MTPLPDEPSAPQIHCPLLDKLLRHTQQPVTRHALAQAGGLSPGQLQYELDRLIAAGCVLEEHPSQGLTLVQTGPSCWTDHLQWCLGAHRRVIVYRQTASTQDAARRLIDQLGPAAHDHVIIADQQYAGRGRLGRTWLSPPGAAVTLSLVHVAPSPMTTGSSGISVDRLMFATAVAVARGIEAATDDAITAQIKWPNDVLIDGAKVAGILVETHTLADRRPAAIIGVGINVSASPASDTLNELDKRVVSRTVTCLSARAGWVDRLRVMARLLMAMDHALVATDPAPLVQAWRDRSVLLAQNLTMGTPAGQVQGQVIDLDPYDGLIVRTQMGAIVHLPAATTTIL